MTTRASAFGLLFFPALALALLTACGDRPNQNHASLNRTSPSLAKPCTPATNAIGQHIVTSWKAAPSDALITHPISGLSVRQSFAPHWPGQTVRLRITNRYSSLPVVLDRVHVARERVPGSADVMPDSQCLLKFDGQSLVTLKPGESRVSDWTSYAIAPFERISISFLPPASRRKSLGTWVLMSSFISVPPGIIPPTPVAPPTCKRPMAMPATSSSLKPLRSSVPLE